MQVAYFGCWDHVGYGLYDIYGHTIVMNQLIGFPWSLDTIDGMLCLDNGQMEGEVRITHQQGTDLIWTAMGWWDHSVGTRPNSNSVLFSRGKLDEMEMMVMLKTMFPKIFDRQNVPLFEFPPGVIEPEPS